MKPTLFHYSIARYYIFNQRFDGRTKSHKNFIFHGRGSVGHHLHPEIGVLACRAQAEPYGMFYVTQQMVDDKKQDAVRFICAILSYLTEDDWRFIKVKGVPGFCKLNDLTRRCDRSTFIPVKLSEFIDFKKMGRAGKPRRFSPHPVEARPLPLP